VKRRGIARPSQSDRTANEQRENSHGREHEIQGAGTTGCRRQAQIEHFARAEAKHRVAKRSFIAACIVQHIEDIGGALDWTVIDRQEQIAAFEPDTFRRTPLGYLVNNRAVRTRGPQHAIFDFVPGCAGSDIGNAQAQQSRHDEDRQRRS
jgi:hypothetical protein